ncbi:MAG: sugar ABC transporter permease [Clostridiales bacterium]|nr:sugar ABC transporter permease [Clostridiales bacterium]
MQNRLRGNSEQRTWHLMLVPALVLALVFSYLPMFGIVMAFQKFNPGRGFFGSAFIGLDNFRYVFNLRGFTGALYNTVYISFLKIVFGILTPLLVALAINEVDQKRFARAAQTSIFLPFFLSWVVLGGVIRQILDLEGPINSLIERAGGQPIMFLLRNDWFPTVLVVTDVWKGMGYNMVIFLAAISSIDLSPYESAQIDGAGRLKQTWYLTLPALMPTILLLSTLAIGNLLNAGFDQVFMLYNPIVYESGDIIDTFVYRLGLVNRQYAPAAAVGVFKSLVSVLLVGSSYYLAHRFNDYSIF